MNYTKHSNVWIYNTTQSIIRNSNEIIVDVFIHPSFLESYYFEMVDVLGCKYTNFTYDILAYDISTGIGKVSLSLKDKYRGVFFLSLKAQDNIHTKAIMIMD